MRRLSRVVGEGENFPSGYGLAWRDWTCNASVCYPIPLNWLAMWLHDWYFRLTFPRPLLYDLWGKEHGRPDHAAAWCRGFQVGRDSAKRDLERAGYTIMARQI